METESDYPYIYNNLGVAYENTGQLRKAKQAYQQAVKIKPNYKNAQQNLERVKIALDQ